MVNKLKKSCSWSLNVAPKEGGKEGREKERVRKQWIGSWLRRRGKEKGT